MNPWKDPVYQPSGNSEHHNDKNNGKRETDDKIKIVESISQFFNEKFSYKNFTNVQNFGNHIFFHKNSKAEDQYQILLRRNLIHSPSVFLNLNIIKNGDTQID